MNYGRSKQYVGFTLVEVVITVAIVAILATIAYPAYISYANRSHRSDAMSTLSQLQLTLERCYSQNFSYSAACTALPAFPRNSPQGFYTITLNNLGPTTYTLTATARDAQLRDVTCATMSVNQANVKIGLDTGGVAQAACWTP